MSNFDHVDLSIFQQSTKFFSVVLHTINLCPLLGGMLTLFEKLCTPASRSVLLRTGNYLNRTATVIAGIRWLRLGGCRAAVASWL